MPLPWEKQYTAPAAPAGAKPWEKYGAASTTPQPPQDARTTMEKLAATVPGTPERDALSMQLDSENAAHPPAKQSFLDRVGDTKITPDFDVRSLWTAIKGAPENAAAAVNNAAVAGVAGVTAPFVSKNDDDAANFIHDFQAEHSYTPRGDSARELSGALGDALAPIQNAKQGLGDTIMEHTGSPGAATLGYMAPDLAAILMGPEAEAGNYGTVKGPVGEVTAKTKAAPSDMRDIGDFLQYHNAQAPAPIKKARVNPDDPVATARAAGIKLLPSDVQRVTNEKPTLSERIAEGIAPEDVRRDMTMENQKAQNQLVREKVNAPEGTRLNRRGIEQQKEPHFKTYEEVNRAINVVPPSEDYLFALDDATQKAGFPKGSNPSVTEVISALRTKARRKKNNPAADDKLEAEGQLAGQAADTLEEAMGNELKNTGQEDLLAKYQNARQSLGELNDIKKTQRGGNTDAQKMFKLDEKNPDRLTGQTKMLADIGEHFPDLKSSMTGAGKKKTGGGELTREGVIARGAKKVARGAVKGVAKVIPQLGDRLLVDSEGFQTRNYGAAATPTERTYFADYGKKPPKGGTGAPPSQEGPGGGPVDFTPTSNVPSGRAVSLADRLGLAPEAVDHPQALPEKPDTLTAETPPRSRGDVTPHFDAQAEADKLAGDLGIDVRTGTHGAIGKKELSDLLAEQGAGDTALEPLSGRAIREKKQGDMVGDSDKSAPLQLTKPNQRAKVSAATDKRGNITVRHEDGGEITAIDLPDQGVVQIKDSKVPEGSRGQGRGQAMAQALMQIAAKKGRRLISDNRVSESAQAMWQALKSKGLKVKQNPATRQASGELVSKSELKPVFEILDDAVTE